MELYNAGAVSVDLSGWYFSKGISYVFPGGIVLTQGAYVVVAQKPSAIASKFGFTNALGPFSGGLSKYGDTIELRDARGRLQDSVSYKCGFPWPTVGDAPGFSIELINPMLDNDLGGSWRASTSMVAGAQQSIILIETNSVWKYFKGTNEPSVTQGAWRQTNFNDSAWSVGQAPIGYGAAGDPIMNTPLPDMDGNYTTVYFRKTFVVQDPIPIGTLQLQAMYDDGFKVWINGVQVLNVNMPESETPFNGTAALARESANYDLFVLNLPSTYLVQGTNTIAIQAANASITGGGDGTGDFFLDVRLRAVFGQPNHGPTPGRVNSAYSTNAPPQVRQVTHTPQQPREGQTVRISAKVTDPDGVAAVTLQYQIVDPGKYIELTDTAYNSPTNWIALPMNDQGIDGDEVAGDDVYSVELPASIQINRRLVRYRITVADTRGASVQVPYQDDPQPNFAYFVYNGVPEWTGAVQPGVTAPFTVSSNEMNRLPVVFLIGKSNTIANATWFSRYTGSLYQWLGTLVYDGKVYDHVRYRARGGVWRYSMVKNMWKFDLNRGHDLEVRDNWGRKFNIPWNKLNLGACIQQGDYNHRGEQGMFESLSFRLLQKAGVESPNTVFMHFRVIKDALEVNPASQFEGDFWGLYLAVEQLNSRFLEQHELPDSNFYKMEGGTGELNNLGPNGPADKSDLNYILQNYTGATDAWWRTNWNLAKYYSYQAIVQAIHHYDICYDKNFFYYFDPRTRLWELMPWDTDLTWAHNMFDANCAGIDRIAQKLLNPAAVAGSGAQSGTRIMQLTGYRPAMELEFCNRIREIRDLLWNAEQAGLMIDEHARLLRGAGTGPTFLDADRAQWDYNWRMTNSAYTPNLNKAGQGRFYQFPSESATNSTLKGSFNATVQIMKNYVNIRAAYLDSLAADSAIPNRPTLSYTGPSNYPINRLSFRCSDFSSPSGAGFAFMKWRVAEVTDTNSPAFNPNEEWKYEIDAIGEWTNNVFAAGFTVPPAVLRIGARYRVRVQMTDTTGRASSWSLPVEFTVAPPENAGDLINYLRITEIMYHPAAGGVEFIELYNMSPTLTLDLAGVSFTEGIEFTFPVGATLPPNSFLVLANTSNLEAFRAQFNLPPATSLYGPFASGALDNAGERVTLRTAPGGVVIVSFKYGDGRGWPQSPDGAGHSLVLLDTALQSQNAGSGEYGGNWRASAFLGGSPGRPDPAPPQGPLLNEIFANGSGTGDWIEIYNPTTVPMVLGTGWFLSDDPANLAKWMIPEGTTIPPNGWTAFEAITTFQNPTNPAFGLDKDGEQLFLSFLAGTAEDRVADSISFKAQEPGLSWGRYPDGNPFWQTLSTPTFNAANSTPLVHVVINEIHYHPPDLAGGQDNSLDEFIELYNPADAPIELFGAAGQWRIDGDVQLVLPAGLTIPPGGFILLVNFDPTNSVQSNAFRAVFNMTTNCQLIGPYLNKLPNASGRVALERPQPSGPGGQTSWAIVDEVIYADQPPWPCGSDGEGNSIQRLDSARAGSDPSNWSAQSPTPGSPRVPVPAGVPSIVSQPASQIVPAGSSVEFSVGLCGTPPYSYQWLQNGIAISDATNPVLRLNNLQLSQSGQYAVVVSNPAGSITSQVATLIVQSPPSIAAPPSSIVATGYTTVMFHVVPEGTPPFQFQWLFQGTNIPGATNSSLILTNIESSRAGTYQAIIFNTAGSITSAPASLQVLMPPRLTVPLENVTATNGSNVLITAVATGDPPLFYQWYFNGEPLPSATNSTLTFANIQPSNAGAYQIVVSNAYGTDQSAVFSLTVLVPVSFIQHPQGQTVRAGDSVVLTTVVDGTPPIWYRWRRNGGTYLPFTIGASSLTFSNIQLTNAGTYQVVVTNILTKGAGLLSSNAYLTVVLPPASRIVSPGASLSLTAQVAHPLGMSNSLQWQFAGTNIPNATNSILELTNLQPLQSGPYTLQLSNAAGITAAFTIWVGVDSDGDGLPDDWEIAHGLNPNNPSDGAADSDGDGLTNIQEYQAGTNPGDPTSVLKLLPVKDASSPWKISFLAISNRLYQIEGQEQFGASWVKLAEIPDAPSNRWVDVALPISNRRYFLRLGVNGPR